ncbi:MAG: nicotinate-nucleotide adenylyltransferase [Candidatus Latescibacterota bacterium]
MARVGILGGTFDPPHIAHLVMAEEALAKVPLDKILFMPATHPPHKSTEVVTPYPVRLQMVELSLQGHDHLELSTMEEFRDGPSYTIDLLRHYQREHDDEIYLIIGADSLSDFTSWKDPEKILQLATLVVFPRSGYPSMHSLPGEASIVLLDAPPVDVSSSEIRRRLAAGEPVEHLLPGSVRDYIRDNDLYSR